MPVERPGPPRSFLWHELATSDPEGASDFYGAVLGWRAVPLDGDGGSWTWVPVHRGADTEGSPGKGRGGLTVLLGPPRGEESPPAWQGYVWTPDPEMDARRAESLGGRIVTAPHAVPSVGRMTVIEDPLGARLTLMCPSPPEIRAPEAPSADSPAEEPLTGRFIWHELTTPDPDAALDFYGKLLGWEVTGALDLGERGRCRMFGSQGTELGGISTASDVSDSFDRDAGRHEWLYHVLVGNLGESLRRVGKSGGEVVYGPTEAPGVRLAHCRDPQGAHFALREKWKGRPAA